jgi:RadC-like JAB domain
VHNHPSGATKPSEADLIITERVVAAAQILRINFLDHVIIGRGTNFSFASVWVFLHNLQDKSKTFVVQFYVVPRISDARASRISSTHVSKAFYRLPRA